MSEPLLGEGTRRDSGTESPSNASPCHSDPTPRFWPPTCLWFHEMSGIQGDFVVPHPCGLREGGLPWASVRAGPKRLDVAAADLLKGRHWGGGWAVPGAGSQARGSCKTQERMWSCLWLPVPAPHPPRPAIPPARVPAPGVDAASGAEAPVEAPGASRAGARGLGSLPAGEERTAGSRVKDGAAHAGKESCWEDAALVLATVTPTGCDLKREKRGAVPGRVWARAKLLTCGTEGSPGGRSASPEGLRSPRTRAPVHSPGSGRESAVESMALPGFSWELARAGQPGASCPSPPQLSLQHPRPPLSPRGSLKPAGAGGPGPHPVLPPLSQGRPDARLASRRERKSQGRCGCPGAAVTSHHRPGGLHPPRSTPSQFQGQRSGAKVTPLGHRLFTGPTWAPPRPRLRPGSTARAEAGTDMIKSKSALGSLAR